MDKVVSDYLIENLDPMGVQIGDSVTVAPQMTLSVFVQAEDGIRDLTVTGVQTCALPICGGHPASDSRTTKERPSWLCERCIMKLFRSKQDVQLDRAISELRGEQPDAKTLSASAERVWQLLQTSEGQEAATNPLQPIRGCADIRSLLPAFHLH